MPTALLTPTTPHTTPVRNFQPAPTGTVPIPPSTLPSHLWISSSPTIDSVRPSDPVRHQRALDAYLTYCEQRGDTVTSASYWATELLPWVKSLLPNRRHPLIALDAAGFRRAEQMLDRLHPDYVLDLFGKRSWYCELLFAVRVAPDGNAAVESCYLIPSIRRVDQPSVMNTYAIARDFFPPEIRHAPDIFLVEGRMKADHEIEIDPHFVSNSSGGVALYGHPLGRYFTEAGWIFPQAFGTVLHALNQWRGSRHERPTFRINYGQSDWPHSWEALNTKPPRFILEAAHESLTPSIYGQRKKFSILDFFTAPQVTVAALSQSSPPDHVKDVPRVTALPRNIFDFMCREDHMAPGPQGYHPDTIRLAAEIYFGMRDLAKLDQVGSWLLRAITPAYHAAAYWAWRLSSLSLGRSLQRLEFDVYLSEPYSHFRTVSRKFASPSRGVR